MRTIGSDDYMLGIEVPIEEAIEDALFDIFKRIAGRYDFEVPADEEILAARGHGVDESLEQRQFDFFHSYYWDGYAGEFREKAIELFEWLGMDVRPDDKEW